MKNSLLIEAAAGFDSGGNNKRIVMKQTQATAMIPRGMYHLPRVKGPGTSLFLPEVMRKNIGVT